jgi:hypothetical protein
MIILTHLPAFITIVHHRLLLCWVIVMQALYPGRKTLEELARWSPTAVTSWRLRRLLSPVGKGKAAAFFRLRSCQS